VADFVIRAVPGLELHLFADGDHRLTARKDRHWELMGSSFGGGVELT
jgi:hypothetical protein